MKKIILSILVFILCAVNVYAKNNKDLDLVSVIKDFGADKESIAISIKNAQTGENIYSINEKALMNPASVQKILTMPAAIDTLGTDYKFKTEIYSSGKDSCLIKLSGDPYLKSSDLKTLVSGLKPEVQTVYIDSSILDDKTWGEGWQWDDDMNILMPRFGAYNLDKNIIKLTILPEENGKLAQIINTTKYPLLFFNQVRTSNKTSLDIKRDMSVSANTIMLNGTVARPTTVYIPVNNIKRYFEVQLTQALENRKMYLKNPYKTKLKDSADMLENSVEHDIEFALSDILKNSNNMAAETVFKLAGGKYKGNVTGTDTLGIEMFNSFCKKLKIDNSSVKITDGSGVSKNNLVNADFVSEYLNAIKNNPAVRYLPSPGEGTLTQRLLPIKNNLKAKTGTLSGISSIAGYITARSGKSYTFCIIQNDVKLTAPEKKQLEDTIIKEMYLKL